MKRVLKDEPAWTNASRTSLSSGAKAIAKGVIEREWANGVVPSIASILKLASKEFIQQTVTEYAKKSKPDDDGTTSNAAAGTSAAADTGKKSEAGGSEFGFSMPSEDTAGGSEFG